MNGKAPAVSPLHRLDPAWKFGAAVAGVLLLTGLPAGARGFFIAYGLALLLLTGLARLSPFYILKKLLAILPFLLLPLVSIPFRPGGPALFRLLLLRSLFSLYTLVIFSATTSFPVLLERLESLRTPRLITVTLALMYRYLFLMAGEVERLKRAVLARSGRGGSRAILRALAGGTGQLFIRSLERGERVYQAMLSRGYQGLTSKAGSDEKLD
ncbi:MAG TPA: CbiQ family ECF transporter T component [bacterium]|nr:CbiQ family ECF transporter T component [bacterium]